MASLRKLIGSRYWIAQITLPDGKRTCRSTKQTNRASAQKIADAYEAASRERMTEAQLLSVFSDLCERMHGRKIVQTTVEAYAEQWLARKEGEIGESTMHAYQGAVNGLVKWLGDRATMPLQHLTPAVLAEWRDDSAKRASPKTANNKLKIARIMLQTAWRDGLVAENVGQKVVGLKTQESNRRPFTIAEIKAILGVADQEWRGMVLFGLYTGQRLRDIAGLSWANVDLQKGEIRLSTAKTGRLQAIPIASPLRDYLESLPSSDDPKGAIFPALSKHSDTINGAARLSQMFYDVLVDAALVPKRPPKHISTGVGRSGPRERSGISFHCLRHTATSLLKNAGVSEIVARDLIGHDSAAVSANYSHVDEGMKRLAIQGLPDVTK